MRKSLLFLSISCALGQGQIATAQESDPEPPHMDLERITVRALPVDRSALDSAEPIDVLAGEALDDRRGMTLGETLANQPGVHSSYYGPGAGRPIIRGLGGPRVRILEDGLSTGDASAPSDDHAVSADPLLIDQIEILRGPATLLYGSDASGGVVNLIDHRIPEQRAESPLTGRFEVRGDSVANERSGVARLTGGGESFAWHLDGSWRDADDYDIPGQAVREPDQDADEDHEHDHHDHDGEDSGTLNNSFVESVSGTFGASWIGERGFLGASVRRFETEYGIPAPHGHGGDDHEHEEETEDEHGDESEHGEEEEEGLAFIDMKQTSWDVSGQLDDPLPGFTRARLRLGYNDYRHREIEVEQADHDSDHDDDHAHDDDRDHEPTQFDIETWQARLELRTRPLSGWAGAIGLQYDREDFFAEGEEAFVAPNETDALALFVLQEQQFGPVNLSFGARIERSEIKADLPGHEDVDDHAHDHDHESGIEVEFDRDRRSFTNWSASLGAVWQISELWQSSFSLARSQRAPSATELFSNGPHLATFSFEIGDPNLGRETTLSSDFGVHRHSENFDLDINLFHKVVDDFIYLADTGLEEDGFAVRQAVQEDTEFYGLEAEAAWQVHGTGLGDFDLRLGYDLVRGKLDEGGDLPRISPERLSSGIDWHHGPWRAGLEWQRVFRQDRTAEFETETPGYNLVNSRIAYDFSLGKASLEAFLEGRNLGNNEARVHTSFLRDFAPLPGRNFRFGLRGRF